MTSEEMDSAMLQVICSKLSERIDACHAVETGTDGGYTAEARQAIREEKMWLSSLLMEIKEHIHR